MRMMQKSMRCLQNATSQSLTLARGNKTEENAKTKQRKPKELNEKAKKPEGISLKTKEMMTERDRLHKTASETQKPEDWRKFKDLRNKINNRLKSEEKDWQRKKLNDCEDDSKKLWKNLKNILNWNSSGSPSRPKCRTL